MSYTTIKIPIQIHRKIKHLSQISHTTQYDVLEQSLNKFEKDLFWADCVEAYEKNSVEASQEDDFSGTLSDGLEDIRSFSKDKWHIKMQYIFLPDLNISFAVSKS